MNSYYGEQFSEYKSISVKDLPTFLDDFGKDSKVLSLDCFDTLLWRKFMSPSDVFFQLGKENKLPKGQLSVTQRVSAEKKLRNSRFIVGLPSEVTLEEIYESMLPDSSEASIASLVKNEINLEKKACFIFKPIYELAVSAKKRGLKTIIVSDIYLSANQLQSLIEHCTQKLGWDCPIDHFFASSDYRLSKSEGLLEKVAQDLNLSGNQILHLGDNLEADLYGARRVGVQGYHFEQFNKQTEDFLHQFSNIASTLQPNIRYTEPLISRWRPIWATLEEATKVENIGSYTLGPVLKNFYDWIADQVSDLSEKGEKPRVIFLLRDGYFPSIIYREFAAKDNRLKDIPTANLEISRFVAFACSFNSKKSIIKYLEAYADTPAFEELLTQLLYSKSEINKIVKKVPRNDDGIRQLNKKILLKESVNNIINRSGLYKKRFYKRLASVVAPEPGETLVMVDLGYEGTIQNCMEDILERDLNIKTLTLLLFSSDYSMINKKIKGMINSMQYDSRTLASIYFNINPLEQVCAYDGPSVRDFLEDGSPVFSKEVIPLSQRKLRGMIQEATLSFLQQISKHKLVDISAEEKNDETMLLLGRFLLTPSPDELSLFNDAIHDFNLGSDQTDKLIDRGNDEKLLKRRGIIGVGDANGRGNAWRYAAVSANVVSEYISSIRFGKTVKIEDSLYSQILVRFLTKNGSGHSTINLYKTHDGYVRAIIPVSKNIEAFALFCGESFKWVEFNGVYLEPIKKVFGKIDQNDEVINLTSGLVFENIDVHADGLLEMKSKESFILVGLSSEKISQSENKICAEVIFRPLVER